MKQTLSKSLLSLTVAGLLMTGGSMMVAAPAIAQEEQKASERPTRRTPALRSKVYEQLARAQEKAEAALKSKEELMDEDALKAEKAAEEQAAEKAAEEEAKAAAKAEAKAAKEAEAVSEDATESEETETAQAAEDGTPEAEDKKDA